MVHSLSPVETDQLVQAQAYELNLRPHLILSRVIWSFGMRRTSLALALIALSAPCLAPRHADAESLGPLARCIEAEGVKLDFSGVVSISQPAGVSVYSRGRLDGSAGPKIGPDTRFNLASAGKMFTAVAVAQLVDTGKVSLDAPIGRYVPSLTVEAQAVTIRQLLTHSSGLGNYLTPENLPVIERAHATADLLPLILPEKPAFTPGTRFQYSNSGFVLLGLLIEHVSGESYAEYLSHHIFGPAGMTESGLEPSPADDRAIGMTTLANLPFGSPAPGERAGRLVLGPGGDIAPPQGPLRPAIEASTYGGPAGGSYSSANDMQRFFKALLDSRLTSQAMLRELTSVQIVVSPAKDGMPEHDYGLGFGAGVYDGHRWVGHNGGAPGVNTETAAYPDDHTEVIVLSDRDPPTATALFHEVRKMVLKPACR